MKNSENSEIAQISQRAWKIAEALSKPSIGAQPPVLLDAIAKSLGVVQIRFAPLFSDAGLAKVGDGFEIVINADSEGGLPAGTTFPVDGGKWTELSVRLRFRIAHELAHLVFLRAAQQDRQSAIFEKNERAVENGCNILSRLLLLPKHMLIHELEAGIPDLHQITALVAAFQVAPQTLILRLHLSDMKDELKNKEVVLCLVGKGPEGRRVVACHIWGGLAQQRFDTALLRAQGTSKQRQLPMSLSVVYRQAKWVMEGCKLNEIKLHEDVDLESVIQRMEPSGLVLEVEWGDGNVLPCKINSLPLTNNSDNCLVGIQLLGPVQRSGQMALF